MTNDSHLAQLIRVVAGDDAAAHILDTVTIDRRLLIESAGAVSRGAMSMALHGILFYELLGRVPSGAAYVADRRRQRERIVLDHGASRTVRLAGSTGTLPGGVDAFSRLLLPLGYHVAGTYPLERLGMTGYAFTHRDFPETVPQFFISELHVDRFSASFQAAARRVFGGVQDRLGPAAHPVLDELSRTGRSEMKRAAPALKELAAAFARWHVMPSLEDYRTLLEESAEAAWIATEGSSFNHATDRVADVAMTACAQRSLGRPVKESIETSVQGSIRQTAFKAELVRRVLRDAHGQDVVLSVPGSFYEFISRDTVIGADGRRRLDLRFDSQNAQGIFKMTASGR